MLKAALALVLLAPVAVLAAACIADVSEDDTGDAQQAARPAKIVAPPLLPPGPCTTACDLVQLGACGDWQADCAYADPGEEYVVCGPTYLTCGAAKHGITNGLAGTMWCYRDCMKLN